jgi:hypothetical protein
MAAGDAGHTHLLVRHNRRKRESQLTIQKEDQRLSAYTIKRPTLPRIALLAMSECVP